MQYCTCVHILGYFGAHFKNSLFILSISLLSSKLKLNVIAIIPFYFILFVFLLPFIYPNVTILEPLFSHCKYKADNMKIHMY